MYLIRSNMFRGDKQVCDSRFGRSCLFTPSYLIIGSSTDSAPPSMGSAGYDNFVWQLMRLHAFASGLADYTRCRITCEELDYSRGVSWTDYDKPIPFGEHRLAMTKRNDFCSRAVCSSGGVLPEILA